MRNLFIGILLSFVAVACTSETKEVFLDGEELLPPTAPIEELVTKCCDAAMTTGDSSKISRVNARGWGKPADKLYPLDSIYIVSGIEDDAFEKGSGKYEPVNPKNVVAKPIEDHLNSKVGICFQHGPGAEGNYVPEDGDDLDDDDVYMTVNGKTIKVDDCIFSSVPTTIANMVKSDTITTPGDTTSFVYEPFGDSLFYSDPFEAELEKGGLEIETKSYKNGKEHEVERIVFEGQSLEIALKRFTTVLHNKLIVSNIKDDKGPYELSQQEFEKVFGSVKNWSVRVFINNAPTEFNYGFMYDYPEGTDIIALSKYQLPFGAGVQHFKSKESKSDIECEGVGAEDLSDPHIFPMKVKKSSGKVITEICYSFYYTGNKSITFRTGNISKVEKPILKHTTIRIPVDKVWYGFKKITQFEANTKYFLTHMIDIEDFKKGVTGYYDKTRSGESANYDPLFGYVMDIPCKTAVEVRK